MATQTACSQMSLAIFEYYLTEEVFSWPSSLIFMMISLKHNRWPSRLLK